MSGSRGLCFKQISLFCQLDRNPRSKVQNVRYDTTVYWLNCSARYELDLYSGNDTFRSCNLKGDITPGTRNTEERTAGKYYEQ